MTIEDWDEDPEIPEEEPREETPEEEYIRDTMESLKNNN